MRYKSKAQKWLGSAREDEKADSAPTDSELDEYMSCSLIDLYQY